MRNTFGSGAVVACVLAVASVVAALASPSILSSGAGEGRRCERSWRVQPSPNPGSAENDLRAVSALSPRRAWAVGSFADVEALQPLIERWDGERWTVVPSPTFAQGGNLNGVDARSRKDAWAVGARGDPCGVFKTVIEHWDGGAWRLVPSPNAGLGPEGNGTLNAVLSLSRRNAWAVGSYLTEAEVPQPLIEHWDGRRWWVVPSPTGLGNSALRALAGTSASDIWAVGHKTVRVGTGSLVERALIMHWDGAGWTEVPARGLGIDPSHPYGLAGVVALSRRNAWAVGGVSSETASQTLVLRWDGSAWKRIRSPQPSADFQSLDAIAAINARKVWAVGSYRAVRPDDTVTLVQRWNGKRWRIVPSENGASISELLGVAAVGRARFAVGSYWANAGQGPTQTLVLHGCRPTAPRR